MIKITSLHRIPTKKKMGLRIISFLCIACILISLSGCHSVAFTEDDKEAFKQIAEYLEQESLHIEKEFIYNDGFGFNGKYVYHLTCKDSLLTIEDFEGKSLAAAVSFYKEEKFRDTELVLSLDIPDLTHKLSYDTNKIDTFVQASKFVEEFMSEASKRDLNIKRFFPEDPEMIQTVEGFFNQIASEYGEIESYRIAKIYKDSLEDPEKGLPIRFIILNTRKDEVYVAVVTVYAKENNYLVRHISL